MQAKHPPSWWALVFAVIADATAYISLLFGSLFLWISAPNWPPEQPLGAEIFSPFVTLVASLAVALAGSMAVLTRRRRREWLLVAALAHTVAASSLFWLAVSATPDPRTHAAAASVFAILLYAALHNGLGVVFAGYGIWRIRNGFVSRKRDLDLRLGQIWHTYCAVLGVVSAFFSLLLGALISGTTS